MKIVFVDFETHYSNDYSLRKITPVEYILDPRFEVQGCAVQEGVDGEPYWIDGPDLQAWFDSLPPEVMMVSHNALFDMCIVRWVYDYNPKVMVDTLGVARAVLAHEIPSMALHSVGLHLGLGGKTGALAKVKGMTLADIQQDAQLYADFKYYAENDVRICAGIFEKLVMTRVFPMSEVAIMDMVLRCATEPKFVLDDTLLAAHLGDVQAKKEQLLAQAMLIGADGKTDLRSNEKFAELLRQQGVEPPMKLSSTTGMLTYAFAKSDVDFMALLDHDNPVVRTLIEARLGHKSSLEETRTERLISISRLQWPSTFEGKLLPVPLAYGAAHTHRLGGDWKLNLQNFPARDGNNLLRRSLTAPPGHKVFTIDSSQIEARIVAWLCGQVDLVELFAKGEDVYASFASAIFGHPVNKKDHPSERFVGKTGILGLGYGTGAAKFKDTVKTQGKIDLPLIESQSIVNLYRSKYSHITSTWRWLGNNAIPVMAGGGARQKLKWGPVTFVKEAVILPNGLRLHYKNLRSKDGEWLFDYGRETGKRIYGGKLLENIVQALARIIVMDAALRIQRRCSGLDWFNGLALQVHDELGYILPEWVIEDFIPIAMEEMSRSPSWGEGIPVTAEYSYGDNYGEAK